MKRSARVILDRLASFREQLLLGASPDLEVRIGAAAIELQAIFQRLHLARATEGLSDVLRKHGEAIYARARHTRESKSLIRPSLRKEYMHRIQAPLASGGAR